MTTFKIIEFTEQSYLQGLCQNILMIIKEIIKKERCFEGGMLEIE
jgi:hypothetical protein